MVWRVLRVVGRTVLPRAVTLETARGRLDVMVGGQGVVLCPRRNGVFLIDEPFRKEAPEAAERLLHGRLARDRAFLASAANQEACAASQGIPEDAAIAGDLAALAGDREALLRLWARAVLQICEGQSSLGVTIEALRDAPWLRAGLAAPLTFGAMELLGALGAVMTAPGADSQVRDFYAAQRRSAPDAWLFHAAGWPAAYPSETADFGRISAMAEAAETARAWRGALADIGGPIMSVLIGAQRDAFRCIAVDDAYVALITRPAAELGAALAAWRGAEQIRTVERPPVH